MNINQVFAFLVPPNKAAASPIDVNGIDVPLSGQLFAHVAKVFGESLAECRIEMALRPSEDGQQKNEFRDLLVNLLKEKSLQNAGMLARRLSNTTTRRSGLGLLFVVLASDQGSDHVLLSRFPTSSAILVDDASDKLNVQFLDKVFVKTYLTYKAAIFHGQPVKGDFWTAKVLDRQISGEGDGVSHYWAVEFLSADFATTSARGTSRMAEAIRKASMGSDFEQKKELHHIAGILAGFDGKSISPNGVLTQLNASDAVRAKVQEYLGEASYNDHFVFNGKSYNSIINFRTVETAEGAIVSALSADFDKVFTYETLSREDGRERVRLATEGILASDKLRRSK